MQNNPKLILLPLQGILEILIVPSLLDRYFFFLAAGV